MIIFWLQKYWLHLLFGITIILMTLTFQHIKNEYVNLLNATYQERTETQQEIMELKSQLNRMTEQWESVCYEWQIERNRADHAEIVIDRLGSNKNEVSQFYKK